MATNQSNFFVYESSRHAILIRDYAKLSTFDEYIEWGKRAQDVAAYMDEALSKVKMAISYEKRRLEKENDINARRNIEMGLMQYESFGQIVQKQLDDLIRLMENLPTGSIKPIVKEVDKSKIFTSDSPYLKIFVKKTGDVFLDGNITNMDVLSNALKDLVQKNGVVLYGRESSKDSEAPAIIKTVLDLVIQNRLPIRLCQESDFSDAIDANGKLRVESSPA